LGMSDVGATTCVDNFYSIYGHTRLRRLEQKGKVSRSIG
jgi:hypothetical protein